MLTEILSRETCAECRVCCVFDKTDYWEMPLFSPELAKKINEEYPEIRLEKRNEKEQCKVINPEFDEFDNEGLYRCPLLTEKGCALGTEKPFDCRIWPFRVMKKGDLLLLTVSPVCETVSNLPIARVSAFAGKIAPTVFEEVEKYPEMIKDYIEGYPIFAVK